MLEHGLFLTPTGVRRTLCNWPQLRSIYSNTCCKFRRLLSLTGVNIPQLGSIHPNRDQNTQPPVCLWLSDSETRFRYLKWIWTFQKYWKYLRPRLVFLKNLKISKETSWFSCHLQAYAPPAIFSYNGKTKKSKISRDSCSFCSASF